MSEHIEDGEPMRPMTRYRIRRTGNQWIIYRHIGILGWWTIAATSTWSGALAYVNRRIHRARGTQADYALAAPGRNR